MKTAVRQTKIWKNTKKYTIGGRADLLLIHACSLATRRADGDVRDLPCHVQALDSAELAR
jgi:hypothetical protein